MPQLTQILLFALASCAVAIPASSSKPAPPPPAPTADTKSLYQDLFTAPSDLQRYQRLLVGPSGDLLTGDALKKQISFDYNVGPDDQAGKVTAAVAQTFPILVDQDISTVVAFLNRCSLLVPHTHPQIESLVVTKGSIITGTLIPGLVGPGHGTGEIVQTLKEYEGTVFPKGAIHYQMNPTCDPAIFVSSLSSSDPGTTLESTFFFVNGDVVSAALGFPDSVIDAKNIDTIRGKIPQGVVISMKECMKKCEKY